MVVMPGMAAMIRKQRPIIAKPMICSRRCPIRSSRTIASTYPGTAVTTKMASWIAILVIVEAVGEIRLRICGVEIVSRSRRSRAGTSSPRPGQQDQEPAAGQERPQPHHRGCTGLGRPDHPPVRITGADLAHAADAHSGQATVTFLPALVDTDYILVIITYADGATDRLGVQNMIEMGGPSVWRMSIGTDVNPGPSGPPPAVLGVKVSGAFVMVGGTAPGVGLHLPGRIVATNTAGRRFTGTVGKSGRFRCGYRRAPTILLGTAPGPMPVATRCGVRLPTPSAPGQAAPHNAWRSSVQSHREVLPADGPVNRGRPRAGQQWSDMTTGPAGYAASQVCVHSMTRRRPWSEAAGLSLSP